MRYAFDARCCTTRPPRAWSSASIAIAVFAVASVASATTYKWVDDNGVVHYTDRVPAEQVDKGRVELNKQGVAVKKIDPVPTPEQRRAKEAEEARAREVAREKEELARKNRALLQSYTSEAEIELARKRTLSTLDASIQSAQAYSDQLHKRKVEVERRKTEFGDKPVPAVFEREATTVNLELARQADLIAQKKKEIVEVQAKYDGVLARWRELTSSKEATEAALNAPAVVAPAAAYPGDAAARPTPRK